MSKIMPKGVSLEMALEKGIGLCGDAESKTDCTGIACGNCVLNDTGSLADWVEDQPKTETIKIFPSVFDTQVDGNHYNRLAIQPVEYCEANKLPSIESNVIKYTTRHEFKHGAKDIKKAIHNLCMRLEMTYEIKSVVRYDDE